MSVVLVRGDARELPLPDESVDLVVTSPPYFGQRDYRDNGQSMAGQIGSEETPREYIAALLDCTREWMRVLKPTGSLFVNLGDKYASGRRFADRHISRASFRASLRSSANRGLGAPERALSGCRTRTSSTMTARGA